MSLPFCQLCAMVLAVAQLPAATRVEDREIAIDRRAKSAATNTERRFAPSLIPTVAALDKHDSVPIGAAFTTRGGHLVASVIVAHGEKPASAAFSEIARPVLDSAAPSYERSEFAEPTVDSFRSQTHALNRSSLCLVEAICLAECVTNGQVQSITPTEHEGAPAFHVVIRLPGARLLRAYLDPAACTLAQIGPR